MKETDKYIYIARVVKPDDYDYHYDSISHHVFSKYGNLVDCSCWFDNNSGASKKKTKDVKIFKLKILNTIDVDSIFNDRKELELAAGNNPFKASDIADTIITKDDFDTVISKKVKDIIDEKEYSERKLYEKLKSKYE